MSTAGKPNRTWLYVLVALLGIGVLVAIPLGAALVGLFLWAGGARGARPMPAAPVAVAGRPVRAVEDACAGCAVAEGAMRVALADTEAVPETTVVEVTMAADGSLTLAGETVTPEALEARLRGAAETGDATLRIAASADVPMARVTPLMDMAARSGCRVECRVVRDEPPQE